MSLEICFSQVEEHISLGICFLLGRGTHITSDTCFRGRGTHITSDICFQGRETHITRDMSFSGRGTHIITYMCFPAARIQRFYTYLDGMFGITAGCDFPLKCNPVHAMSKSDIITTKTTHLSQQKQKQLCLQERSLGLQLQVFPLFQLLQIP